MKSRWTTYLLLAAVAAVWGLVAWKICAPAGAPSAAAGPIAPVPAAPVVAADTLLLDYPDPFLKGTARPVVATRAAVHPLPAAKAAAPRRGRVEIAHLATVRSLGRVLYILTVGERQYELLRGEAAGEFVLTACDRDSLYLCKDGVTCGVKLCD